MRDSDFEYVEQLVRKRSGLVLTAEKSYLIESRLAPIARKEGMSGVDELVQSMRQKPDERVIIAVVDAMTTNETFFFRDKTPFDLLKDDVIPPMTKARPPGHKLRIWCAAASSGQEPYSIAMLIDQTPAIMNGLGADILATDISDRVLEKARTGAYTQFEVQRGLSIQMLMKYFDKKDDQWRISDRMRAAVRFQALNLLSDFRFLGRFDIVFCRNVLIYFDTQTKRDILERMARQMPDDGVLLLGAAETVLGLTDAFKPAPGKRGLYVRNASWKKAAA